MIESKLFGTDLFGHVIKPKASGVVAERFLFSPFSVLDTRSGNWQDRKRAWASIGIKGEIGRDAKTYNTSEWIKENGLSGGCQNLPGTEQEWKGTSIFDPVLCECLYNWFSTKGSQVVDPFAGGSVRGIVAGALGRKYWGCDLRSEQVEANNAQANEIDIDIRPEWVCGNSAEFLSSAPAADFVFSCPPYGDLEKYSDHPDDLSAMDWNGFVSAYREIIGRSVMALKENRFACFVVGDFRDNRGLYRDFVSLTIDAFRTAGASLYNEAILLNVAGSAAIRVTKQFNSGRKFCKVHQNVLVFCKGDWRAAAEFCNSGE